MGVEIKLAVDHKMSGRLGEKELGSKSDTATESCGRSHILAHIVHVIVCICGTPEIEM